MAKLTPMMEQYFDIKRQYNDCLLFFRLGDFYEMFFDDALTASKELEITLTGRDCGQEKKAPMCGVPYHSADGYISRLVEKGYKVAICEQVENPKETKTIVKREVIRVVTPGTVIDSNMLEDGKNNYIMCIYQDKNGFGIAIADITTGEFLVTDISSERENKIIDEIAKFSPREIILNDVLFDIQIIQNVFSIRPSKYSPWAFEHVTADKKICEHFKLLNLNGFGISNNMHCIAAAGGLLQYLSETQKNSLSNIITLRYFSVGEYMAMDISSRRNLELTETIREKTKKSSLLWVLDKTKTAMGARLIRKWIEQPLLNVETINKRLGAVEELKDNIIPREELREFLNTIFDIERIISKIIYVTANSRDLVAFKKSFENLPHIKNLLQPFKCELLTEIHKFLDCCEDLFELVDSAIIEEPPVSIREGGFIKDGFNADLDRLREAKDNGTSWLLELENKEREETGIKNLKIRYNKIFGYNIEITNSNKDNAPDRYIRRQTLSNCERFTIPELKKIEEEILGADEKIFELEFKIFNEICAKISEHMERIHLTSSMIATLDVLQSFAHVSDKQNYCKPEINNKGLIDIREGRHPVIEQTTQHAFVPNDTYLDTANNRVSVITGPNMAGKSTFMRQTALIVLMAQCGCFISAESGKIGIVDRIFTRVGASDDLATGQSTFMVEMSEVANILNNATSNSLLILDEIGRGTSTFDGLSIAWSVLEYIAVKIKAKTLFATHYHELTELEGKVDGTKNYCFSVLEEGEDVVFLRKISRGGAGHSYGIHVAKLAGLPKEVINRSNVILAALNNADIVKNSTPYNDSVIINNTEEYSGVDYSKRKKNMSHKQRMILRELQEMNVDALTPIEAQRKLYEISEQFKGLDKFE